MKKKYSYVDKNATVCPVTPYFSFPNFVMTYLICCAFPQRQKTFKKEEKNEKSQFSPSAHFSDSELSPTPFSTKI